MAENNSLGSSPSVVPVRGGKSLRRSNSDRLRMHAPSSIQVSTPTTRCVAEWKIAIPLLSPLDQAVEIWKAEGEEEKVVVGVSGGGGGKGVEDSTSRMSSTWQHPAAPFYYDPPVPANVTASFLLPPHVHTTPDFF